MENSLHTVQTVAKIAKVIALILFIILCLCAVMMIIGIAIFPTLTTYIHIALEKVDLSQFGDFADTLAEFFDNGILDKFLIVSLVLALISIVCIGVVTFLAYYWFKREIKDGTPFTHRFAADMKRLGTIMLIVDLGLPIILGIAAGIALPSGMFKIQYNLSALDGLIFIIIGIISKYGACLADKAEILRLAAESAGNAPETPTDNGENTAE